MSTSPRLPLIVVGSLRAGGGGKTPVTLELARYLKSRGKRVGILAFRIHGKHDVEIDTDSRWQDSSDEAILLQRKSGARVYVTRDRARLWRHLEASGEFDVLLADDGIMDSRLSGPATFRILLVRHGERPDILDLLPTGPYHLTSSALKKVDFVFDFSRQIVLPGDFDFSKPRWILSGMGNPTGFQMDLQAAGVRVMGHTKGPNHSLPNMDSARRDSRSSNAFGFLYTAKDGIKLPPLDKETGVEIEETVPLSPAILSAVDVFLAPASS